MLNPARGPGKTTAAALSSITPPVAGGWPTTKSPPSAAISVDAPTVMVCTACSATTPASAPGLPETFSRASPSITMLLAALATICPAAPTSERALTRPANRTVSAKNPAAPRGTSMSPCRSILLPAVPVNVNVIWPRLGLAMVTSRAVAAITWPLGASIRLPFSLTTRSLAISQT